MVRAGPLRGGLPAQVGRHRLPTLVQILDTVRWPNRIEPLGPEMWQGVRDGASVTHLRTRPLTRRVGRSYVFHQSARVGQAVVQPRAPDRSSTAISAARRRAAFRSLNPVLRSYRRPSMTLRRNQMSPRRLNPMAAPSRVQGRRTITASTFAPTMAGFQGVSWGRQGHYRKVKHARLFSNS